MKFLRIGLALAVLGLSLFFQRDFAPTSRQSPFLFLPSKAPVKHRGIRNFYYVRSDSLLGHPTWILKATNGYSQLNSQKEELWTFENPEVIFYKKKQTKWEAYSLTAKRAILKSKAVINLTLSDHVTVILPSGAILTTAKIHLLLSKKRKEIWAPCHATLRSLAPRGFLEASSLEGDLVKKRYTLFPPVKMEGETSFKKKSSPANSRGFFRILSSGRVKVSRKKNGKAIAIFLEKSRFFYRPAQHPDQAIVLTSGRLELAGTFSTPFSPDQIDDIHGREGVTFQRGDLSIRASEAKWDPKKQAFHLVGSPWMKIKKGKNTFYAQKAFYLPASKTLVIPRKIRGKIHLEKSSLPSLWNFSGQNLRFQFSPSQRIWQAQDQAQRQAPFRPFVLASKTITLIASHIRYSRGGRKISLLSSPGHPVQLTMGKNTSTS